MLVGSAEAWNRGDLDAFLDDYLASPEPTFAGGAGVIRGVDQIRERYLRGYWSTGRPRDALRFEAVEVQALGSQHALAHGRYVLTDPATAAVRATGYFSLVLRRTPDGWKILHDHSSAAP